MPGAVFGESVKGSPPRMRGKVILLPSTRRVSRITPAHAGKSGLRTQAACGLRDHPRTCGEKQYRIRVAAPGVGSPPHMRGKDWDMPKVRAVGGITPAHAGKRRPLVTNQQLYQDHPRTCGEKPSPGRAGYLREGSPPRMRGKDAAEVKATGPVGITPALAGKSGRCGGWPE